MRPELRSKGHRHPHRTPQSCCHSQLWHCYCSFCWPELFFFQVSPSSSGTSEHPQSQTSDLRLQAYKHCSSSWSFGFQTVRKAIFNLKVLPQSFNPACHFQKKCFQVFATGAGALGYFSECNSLERQFNESTQNILFLNLVNSKPWRHLLHGCNALSAATGAGDGLGCHIFFILLGFEHFWTFWNLSIKKSPAVSYKVLCNREAASSEHMFLLCK